MILLVAAGAAISGEAGVTINLVPVGAKLLKVVVRPSRVSVVLGGIIHLVLVEIVNLPVSHKLIHLHVQQSPDVSGKQSQAGVRNNNLQHVMLQMPLPTARDV